MSWGYDGDWVAPRELPNLAGEKLIGIDTETYDPELLIRGAGNVFDNGHVLGMSVAVPDGDDYKKWYLPFKTDNQAGFDRGLLIEWCSKVLTDDVTLVGANLMYDIGWLEHTGININCKYFDVLWAEALLNEHRRHYDLDSIAKDYGFVGKNSNELYEWCAAKFGGVADGRQRANIYRAPLKLVGPYAEGDAELPLRIRDKQLVLMETEGLEQVCDIEHRLIPLLLAMRKRGVQVDMATRDELANFIDGQIKEARDYVRYAAGGRDLNVNSAAEIAVVFDHNGWKYPLTDKQQKPSFTKDFLTTHGSEFAKSVASVRKLLKMKGTFIEGYFDMAHNGRLHCQLNPLKATDGGTVSGRFSCARPNLQNIPSRDPVFGPRIRGLFIPDEGETWVCQDYSQIEYRMLAHYAIGKGSDSVRNQYCTNASTDFHQLIQDDTGLDRKKAKCLNFGMCYGQGLALTAASMGVSEEEAQEFRDTYFERSPYVQATSKECMHRAQSRGWIRTILGRRARFNTWEPSDFDVSRELGTFDTKEECIKATARYLEIDNPSPRLVKRARTYKALNSLLQGSAADMMKKAMVDIWESGVCDTLGAPLISVHDELDWSVPDTHEGEEAIKESAILMQNAIKLRVPLAVDTEKGGDWGHVE